MNFSRWYTDTMTVNRVVQTTNNGLTTSERQTVLENIPCRVYQFDETKINMTQTAANINNGLKLACDMSVPIMAGDELIIARGALIGQKFSTIRAFASDPVYYPEPVGGIKGGLSHQEIKLLQQEVVN